MGLDECSNWFLPLRYAALYVAFFFVFFFYSFIKEYDQKAIKNKNNFFCFCSCRILSIRQYYLGRRDVTSENSEASSWERRTGVHIEPSHLFRMPGHGERGWNRAPGERDKHHTHSKPSQNLRFQTSVPVSLARFHHRHHLVIGSHRALHTHSIATKTSLPHLSSKTLTSINAAHIPLSYFPPSIKARRRPSSPSSHPPSQQAPCCSLSLFRSRKARQRHRAATCVAGGGRGKSRHNAWRGNRPWGGMFDG